MRRRSVVAASISVFGALHAVLTAIPGIWRSWMIVVEPLEGMVLGPYAGFMAALVGSVAGRVVRPRTGLYALFGISEPVGALTAGLAFKGRWKIILTVYAAMLSAYFIHPLGRRLPAWCLWDVYLATVSIPLVRVFYRRMVSDRLNPKTLLPAVALTSFIGVEADTLTRILLFVPCNLYKLMGVPEEALPYIWMAGAIQTPIESAVSVLVSTTVGIPTLIALLRGRVLEWPLT